MSSEWELVDPNTFQRKLRGGEVFLNKSEQDQQGNFQLVFAIYFETNIPIQELEQHLKVAWYRVRQIYPVIAVNLQDGLLDVATFQTVNNLQEANQWSKQTCFIVNDGQTVEEISSKYTKQSMDSSGRQATITLVTSPRNGSAGLIIRMSHVLNGLEAIVIIKEVAQQLLLECHAPLPFVKEDINLIQSRLPASVVCSYQEKFKPKEEDVLYGFQMAAEMMQNYSKNSIGIPIKTDWKSRKSIMHNLRYKLTSDETSAILQTLKEENITMTSAFYACICAAIAQLSCPNGEEEEGGAQLLFSTHAKRWLPTAGEDGGAVISMGIIPGNSWVPASYKELKANNLEELIHLAKKIAKSTSEGLNSPHFISAMDALAKQIQDSPLTDKVEEPLAISRPNLNSQGMIPFETTILTTDSGSPEWIKVTDMIYGGRNTDPTVCFTAQFMAKEFRYYLLFDEKYFDLEETIFLAIRAGSLLRLFVKPTSK